MDAFLGLRHEEGAVDAIHQLQGEGTDGTIQYFTPNGIRISHPQRGLNIIRQQINGSVKTYMIYKN
jgi:hypothetical protein